VILPPKKNYIPQFLKQRDINSYSRSFDSFGAGRPKLLLMLLFQMLSKDDDDTDFRQASTAGGHRYKPLVMLLVVAPAVASTRL
jgi:hypothetical protein